MACAHHSQNCTPDPFNRASWPTRIRRALREVLAHRGQRRALAALDERRLADIGVSPADAAREARKPFWR
jgi:uncharacterized protein YjiS (DUF1127 family)